MDDVVTITDTAAEAAGAPVANDDPDVAVIQADAAADDDGIPERAIRHEDGSIELPLFAPVVLRWRGTQSQAINEDPPVASVTFRRLTGKDVRTVMSAGASNAFFAKLTAASVRAQFPSEQKWLNVFERMDGSDAAACIRIAQSFLESGPKTPGPKSSPT